MDEYFLGKEEIIKGLEVENEWPSEDNVQVKYRVLQVEKDVSVYSMVTSVSNTVLYI